MDLPISQVLLEEGPIERVRMSGLAALRIVQHCKGAHPTTVTGQLLGLDVAEVLEITDAFPFPAADAQEEDDGADYQLNMMRCLRENNVDNNTTGWYQSSGDGGWQTQELVKTFLDFSASIKRCVAVVYDHQLAAVGQLPLHAVVVSPKFAEVFKKGVKSLTFEKLQEAGVTFGDVFTEIPIEVTNNPLTCALLSDLRAQGQLEDAPSSSLDMATQAFLTKNIGHVVELCDDLVAEQNKVTRYHRQVMIQQSQIEAFRIKRRQENAERKARGEDPLPEEDMTLFKPIDPPTLLDNYLISSQMVTYADQVNSFAKQSLAKLHVASGL